MGCSFPVNVLASIRAERRLVDCGVSMSESDTSRLRSVGRLLRDGWIAIGLSLLLLLGIEGLYRVQYSARNRAALPVAALAPPEPNADEPWWTGWYDLPIFKQYHKYDPYRGWTKKRFESPFLNVEQGFGADTVWKRFPQGQSS